MVISTDLALCNNVLGPDSKHPDCIARDESVCSPLFSTEKELPFCAVERPSRWAPLYFLTNPFSGINSHAKRLFWFWYSTSFDETQFLYTSESAFGAAAMGRVVRQPDVALAASDSSIAEEVAVCSPSFNCYNGKGRQRGNNARNDESINCVGCNAANNLCGACG